MFTNRGQKSCQRFTKNKNKNQKPSDMVTCGVVLPDPSITSSSYSSITYSYSSSVSLLLSSSTVGSAIYIIYRREIIQFVFSFKK